MSGLWLRALEEEARVVAPIERMLTAVATVAAAAAIAVALGTALQLVGNWSGFVRFTERLLL